MTPTLPVRLRRFAHEFRNGTQDELDCTTVFDLLMAAADVLEERDLQAAGESEERAND